MENQGSIKRDLLFFALLVVMVKVAMDRKTGTNTRPVLYAPAEQTRSFDFEMVQQESAAQEEVEQIALATPEQEVEAEKFVVHEEDRHIINYIDQAHNQINSVLAITPAATKESAQLQSVRQRLVQLKKRYQHTSPAIALLGPIGTAGIVAKENEIEDNLLKMVNLIRSVLQLHAQGQDEFEPYESVAYGLEQNQALLAQLTQPSDHA